MAFRVIALFSACQPSPVRVPFEDAAAFFTGALVRFFALEPREVVVLLIAIFASLATIDGDKD